MNTKVVAYSNKKLDGFGSVYLCCMNAFATARYDKQLYYHTNFNDLNGKSLHHNYNNDKNYSSIMNEFTGLKTDSSYNESILIDYRNSNKGGGGGGSQGGFRICFPDKYYTESVIKELRYYYYSTSKPNPIECDIAVHIRRGDIAKKNPKTNKSDSERYIKLEYIKNLLEEIDPHKKKRIAIFSQGKDSDFDEINNSNTNLYINYDLQITFHSMVRAPILITSPSMLSVTAALLNENTIYYTNWGGFGKLKHWILKNHKDYIQS